MKALTPSRLGESCVATLAWRLLLLAVVGLVGCSREGHPPGPVLPALRFVRVERERKPLMNDAAVHMVFNWTNRGATPLAFLGVNGTHPVVRQSTTIDGERLEAKPTWIECGTGLAPGVLAAGEQVQVRAYVPRPDLAVRIGVGSWDPELAAVPNWNEWNWEWSEALVADQSAPQEH